MRRARPRLVGVLGGALLLAGGAVLWVPQHALGAGLAVLGLFVLVGLAGWVFGRRSRRPAAGAR